MVEREVVPVPTAMNDEPEDTTLSYKIEDLPADPPVITENAMKKSTADPKKELIQRAVCR